MKTITIKNQKDWDDLPESFEEFTRLEIRSSETIVIRGNPKNSSARLCDSSSAELCDSSSAVLCDSSSAIAYLQSVVRSRFGHKGGIKAYDNTTLYLSDNLATIESQDTVNIISNFVEPSFDEWLERGIVYADGIYQELLQTKAIKDLTVYKTKHNNKIQYVVRKGDSFSHGETIKEAVNDLRFKLSDRDKSDFEDWKLDDIKTVDELIQAYRIITGACELGVKDFCSRLDMNKDYSIKEIIKLTEGHFGHSEFKGFINGQ